MPAVTGTDAALAAEVAAVIARGDYFTEDEYRTITGDDTVPYKAKRSEIMVAHEEAMERLESYARSAWRPKYARQVFRTNRPLITLKRYPISAISGLTVDGSTWTAGDDWLSGDFTVDEESGVIRLGDWRGGDPFWDYDVAIEIDYVYGFNEVPWAIKRPMIEACASLIRAWEGDSKLPRNTSTYTADRTTVELRKDRGLIKPWPWDERASQDVRSYWESYRPKSYFTT